MYYYAMIDDSNIVTTTLQSANAISSPNMISITEEQYTSGNLIGKYYNAATGQFVDPTPDVLAEHSTEQINHGSEWLSDVLNRILTVKRPKKIPELTEVGTIPLRGNCFAHGNGIYVITSYEGYLCTSTDLINWTGQNLGFGIYDICFGDGIFIAYGMFEDGTRKIMKSADCINWTAGATLTDEKVVSIAYGAGYFAIGTKSTLSTADPDDGSFYLTTDGVTLEKKFSKYVYEICYDEIENMFVGLSKQYSSSSDTTTTYIFYGDIANNQFYNIWAASDNSNSVPSCVAYGKGRFIGSGHAYISGMHIHGKWNYLEEDTVGSHLGKVAFGEGAFYIPARYYVYYSEDGITWNFIRVPNAGFADIAYPVDGKLFVSTSDYKVYLADCVESVPIEYAVESL